MTQEEKDAYLAIYKNNRIRTKKEHDNALRGFFDTYPHLRTDLPSDTREKIKNMTPEDKIAYKELFKLQKKLPFNEFYKIIHLFFSNLK